MRKRKTVAILLAGALILGCQAGPAFASANLPDVSQETSVAQEETESSQTEVTETAAETQRGLKEVTVKTDDVEPGAGSFDKKLTYETYDQNGDAKAYLPETITVHGETYVLSATQNVSLVTKEDVVPSTLSYNSEVFTGDESEYEPADSMIGGDGRSYVLVSKTLNEKEAEERTEYKEVKMTYKGVEAGVQIPDKKETEFEDVDTKQTVKAVLDLKDTQTLSEQWKDEFSFPITISGYDADVFVLNGKEIPKTEDLTPYADDFLAYLKLDPESYKVSSINWDGEAYTGADGTVMRNARGTGSKRVRDIEATYSGEVSMPAIVGKSWSYVYQEDIPAEESVIYTMAVTATYEKESGAAVVEEQSFLEKIVGFITATYEAIVEAVQEHPVASALFMVLLAGILAFLMTKKIKNRCVYNKEIKCPYKKHTAETCKSCIHYRQRNKV